MGEKMTPALDDKLRCLQSLLQQMGASVACKTVGEARDALLTAHLTQPAQAVDVGAIRKVAKELSMDFVANEEQLRRWADKLTAAIPNANANAKEG